MVVNKKTTYLLDAHKGTHHPLRLRTICEVHRQIYDLLVIHSYQDSPAYTQIKDLLEEAFCMSIKLVATLCEYKADAAMIGHAEEWESQKQYDEANQLRQERQRLLTLLKGKE